MTIDLFSALQTLAEILIAVVGFIGIIAVYQRVVFWQCWNPIFG